MGERGLARNRKRAKKKKESLKAKPAQEEIEDLLHDALQYLRDELTTYTATRGQYQDVIRIAKALRDLAGPTVDPSVSAAEEARREFLSTFLGGEDQEG